MAVLNKQTLRPGERIRVLIVDDSVVIRTLVTQVLSEDPQLEVVGTASNGVIGLQRVAQLEPHVLTLDIEMPQMDGLELLRHLRTLHPHLRVIMFSTLTERGATATFEALSLGAHDYVTKPANGGAIDRSMARLREDLVPKIKQFFFASTGAQPAASARGHQPGRAGWKGLNRPKAVVIGVSTGGPAALQAILPALPADFPLPILIVQHMPPLFTGLLAERLNATCKLPVGEASQGEQVREGRILIAPGDFHMRLAGNDQGAWIHLDQGAPLNSCRPAVDALFASAGDVYGGAVLAVILTGMGQDGLRGTETLKAQGARVLAQDEASSVVWGMPGAVVRANLADQIVPLDQVAAPLGAAEAG